MTDHRGIAHTAVNQYFASQDQDELATLLAVIDDPGIRRVVEIGTFAGGLTWALERLPHVKQIVTIDLAQRPRYIGGKTQFVFGDSSNDATVLRVSNILDDNFADLLIIDGGHELVQVLSDWELYRGFVRHGGMVVFHDINEWGNHPDMQARDVWLKICPLYPHVEICANRWSSPGTGLLWMIGE